MNLWLEKSLFLWVPQVEFPTLSNSGSRSCKALFCPVGTSHAHRHMVQYIHVLIHIKLKWTLHSHWGSSSQSLSGIWQWKIHCLVPVSRTWKQKKPGELGNHVDTFNNVVKKWMASVASTTMPLIQTELRHHKCKNFQETFPLANNVV